MSEYKQWEEFVEDVFEVRFWKLVNNGAARRVMGAC